MSVQLPSAITYSALQKTRSGTPIAFEDTGTSTVSTVKQGLILGTFPWISTAEACVIAGPSTTLASSGTGAIAVVTPVLIGGFDGDGRKSSNVRHRTIEDLWSA